MAHADELLAEIVSEIIKHEIATRKRIQQRGIKGDHRHVMREEWARFYDETRELQRQYDELLRTMVETKAFESPTMVTS
jgi:hypothetical protein